MAQEFLSIPVELTEDRRARGSVEDDYLAINDVILRIPPSNIRIYKESLNYELSSLRTMYTQNIKSGYGNVVISFSFIFQGYNDINDKLKRLVAGWRATPFCVCYSKYLLASLRGIEAIAVGDSEDYFFYRPIALALRSASITTIPEHPDSLRLEAEMLWFNYHPYMREWVYKTGDPSAQLGTVFFSHLWREFYQPFMVGDEIKWPRDSTNTDAPLQIFYREYVTAPAADARANQAAQDLLQIIQGQPQESFDLLNKFLKDQEVRWTDQNIWDIFWKKVGKDALINHKDVTAEVRARFQQSQIPDGAITTALEYAGAGRFLRTAAQNAYDMDTAPKNIFIGADQNMIDEAIRTLTRRNKEIAAFEANRPSEDATEGASKYVPLPELSIERTYTSTNNRMKHNTNVFGRKRRVSLGPASGIIVESVSVHISYNLSVIPMMAYRYPTIQFAGGVNIGAIVSMNATNEGAAKVNTAYDLIESMAHRYRMVPQGYQNIWIQNDLLNFFNLKEFLTKRLITDTIPGQPGRSQMVMELTHAPVLSTADLGSPETLNQEALQTSSGIFLAIAHRLGDFAVRKNQRQRMEDTQLEGYYLESKIDPNDPAKKALGTLVADYCKIYNAALERVFILLFKKPYLGEDKAWLQFGASAASVENPALATELQKDVDSSDRRAAEGRAELEWRKALSVTDDFDVMLFSSFMGILEKDEAFGTVPNIIAMQNAVIDLENAKKGRGVSELLPGQEVGGYNKDAIARGIAHGRRLEQVGISDKRAQEIAKTIANNFKTFREIFNFLDRYKASLRELTDKIQYYYLDLEAFKQINIAIHAADLQKGAPAYRDFQEQISRVVTYLTNNYDDVDPDITSYNPDVYLYNRMVDGPNANPEEVGILSPVVLAKARQLSLDSHKNATSQVHNWFQNNYFQKLNEGSNTRPAEAITRHVQDDATIRQKGASSNYTHSMYSQITFRNTLAEDRSITKRLTVDGGRHAHINTVAIGQEMRSLNEVHHMTDFAQMWIGAETGSHASPPSPSGAPLPKFRGAKAELVSQIKQAAAEYGVNPDDLVRIAQYESGLNPMARNPSGATGLFQIMPSVAAKEGIDPLDPMASARYTAKQLKDSNKSGYDYYLEHNQGKAGAAAIRKLANGGTVSKELRRTVEYNMANQPMMQSLLATETIRKMPTRTREERLAKQQALVDEARQRYSPRELAQLFMEKQRKQFDGTAPIKDSQLEKERVSTKPEAPKNNVTSTIAKPLEMAYKEFENDLYTGQATGLVRAYPAYKLYFIEDDQGEHRLGFDDFFNYASVQSIRVVRDRNIAADLCELYVTNLSGILSNRKFRQERNPGQARDAAGKKTVETKDASKAGTIEENPLASLMLQEGTHFSVYLGYSNKKENMELVFTGVITELEWMGSEEVIRILGQSYGIELVQDIKGFSKPNTTDNGGVGNFDFWGLAGNAFTGDLLEEMITQPEVLHFGRWSALRQYRTPERDLLTNKWQWKPKPQDDNIFPPPPRDELNDFADGIIFKNLRYTIYRTTIWDIFQEMTLRHPNHIAMAVPYREIGTDRMTMFFGLPNQLYFARDPNLNESNAAAAMRRERDQLEAKLANAGVNPNSGLGFIATNPQHVNPNSGLGFVVTNPQQINPNSAWGGRQHPKLGNVSPMSERERIAHAVKAQQAKVKSNRQETTQAMKALTNTRLAYAKNAGYIRPFRKYHLLTSSFHIVSNNIQANSRDIANTIVVRYNKTLPGKDDIIKGVDNSEVAMSHADQEVTVKLDAALPDEEVRTQVAAFLNVHNSNIARRYALGLLLRNTKNTYKGELVILGNPKIKPHDVCYLFDEYNDMIGPIEVDRVVHVFTPQQGFLTEIKPAMLAQVAEWSLLHSCTAMGVVMEGAMKEHFGIGPHAGVKSFGYYLAESGINFMAPVAGALFDYFGGFMAEAILNYTQFGFPLVMSPLNHHGRVFAGGVPTSKLPKSMWKCIFGDWSPMATAGFNMWLEDKIDEVLGTLKTLALKETQGEFWNNANTLKVE